MEDLGAPNQYHPHMELVYAKQLGDNGGPLLIILVSRLEMEEEFSSGVTHGLGTLL